MNYIPKGSMCMNCAHADKDCSTLSFAMMPTLKVNGDNTVVKCTGFLRRDAGAAESTKIDIRIQAHTALHLADKAAEIKGEMDRLCSKLGLLSQEYLILTEALKVTIADMNGGTYPAPLQHRKFPELSHPG